MKYFWFLVLNITCVLGAENTPLSIIQSSVDFSINLFEELFKGKQGNVVFSSYSLESVLALTSLGAKGDTATQIKSALKLNISDEQIKTEFKTVSEIQKNAKYLKILTANKAYLANDLKIDPEFVKTARDYFDAGVENVDFAKSKEAADSINAWVQKQTNNKIKGLVEESQLDALTRFIIVNSLYFRSGWLHAFNEENTQKRDFHKSKTETIQVDTMKLVQNLPIQRNPAMGVSILQLPYRNTKATFTIILPDEIDGLDAAEKNLAKIWSQVNLKVDSVKVFLPKFKVESTVDLISSLKKLGVTNLFSKADLSGITNETIFVSAIKQKTYVDVNEQGTEAASATAVGAQTRILVTAREHPQEFIVDRPFMFCIQYDGIVLIAGRVNSL